MDMNWLQLENKWVNGLTGIYAEQEAKSLFFISLKHLFGFDKTQYLIHQQEEISPDQVPQMEHILAELRTGKPIQYYLGETEFMGLTFQVNPSVLIPRPETEELVLWILDEVALHRLHAPRILDIGTGSGCIPVSLKSKLPQVDIWALDISSEALATAKLNAINNGVELNFLELDILKDDLDELYDIIVSNPPYVTEAEKAQMHQNVLDFEPHTALFVPDQDSLIFYHRISDLALQHLKPGGLLFFEINEQLGKQTLELLEAKGFHSLELRNDFFGKDRMIKASI